MNPLPPNTDPSDADPNRPTPTHDGGEHDQQVHDFAIEAARQLRDDHCEDVLLFDVRGHSQITDYILIASGTSDRQMRSAGKNLEDLGKNYDMHRYGRDEDAATTWLVVDFVNVMVHLFEPAMRAHYDLEMMWGDAPQIRWRRPQDKSES